MEKAKSRVNPDSLLDGDLTAEPDSLQKSNPRTEASEPADFSDL
jgi:hypothetical protein